jgi:hypothetical protein|tara:strand:- start:146 stop:553 length:408 start_codon:yes stop_codon:yes gene_type:complete
MDTLNIIMRKFLFLLLLLPYVGYTQTANLISYKTEIVENTWNGYEVTETYYEAVSIDLSQRFIELVEIDQAYRLAYNIQYIDYDDGISMYSIDNTSDMLFIDYENNQIDVCIEWNNYTEQFNKCWIFSDIINLNR